MLKLEALIGYAGYGRLKKKVFHYPAVIIASVRWTRCLCLEHHNQAKQDGDTEWTKHAN